MDEIQNVFEWPIVVRRIFDTKNVQIYLTGSSTKLLSKEIATSLRGRSISTEIWPYSFIEYSNAKRIALPRIKGKKTIDKIFMTSLATRHIDYSGIMNRMHKADENRLMPEYIEDYFLRAFDRFDGVYDDKGGSFSFLEASIRIRNVRVE